jgi:cytochrome c oxidase subunit 2
MLNFRGRFSVTFCRGFFMIRMVKLWLMALFSGLISFSGAVLAVQDNEGGPAVMQMNLHQPASQIAETVFGLHTMMLLICSGIFVVVFGVMFYSIWKHRKSKGVKPADFHESVTVEVVWTVIPFIIVILMAIPAAKVVIQMKDVSNSDLTVKVTGYQWKWGYDYMSGEGEGIGFLSTLVTPGSQINGDTNKAERIANPNYLLEVDNPLVVPVGKKIRVVTTAADVIHSWMLPAFAVKQDAIPGFVRSTWFKADKVGTYRGQCVELCGKDHAFMPIVVEVKSAEDYTKWVESKKKEMATKMDDPNKEWNMPELVERGAKVYAANCAACHQSTGMGLPGAFPSLAGSKVVAGPKADQITLLLAGKNAMPSWKSLTDVELAAVATYTRNSFGNQIQEPILPKDIQSARQ